MFFFFRFPDVPLTSADTLSVIVFLVSGTAFLFISAFPRQSIVSNVLLNLYTFSRTRRPPIGGAGKRRITKIRRQAVAGGIFGCFFQTSINADRKQLMRYHIQCSCRLGRHGCRATFGESGLNSRRIIRLFDRPDPFYASLLCSI